MTAAPTALAAGDIKEEGWAGKADGSQMYKTDSSANVPATAVLRFGMAFTPDGAVYTTTQVPTASSTSRFGKVMRADGALHIDTTVSGTIEKGIRRNSNGVWITT